MIHTFEIEGLAIQTGDIICTSNGKPDILPGEFWRLVGRLVPGDVDHVMMYVGPEGRCVEAGSRGVITFDMPDTADAYIHRIGRTGRAQRTGDAFTLVTPEDNDMIRILERIMGSPLKREVLDGFDYKAPAPPKAAGDGRGRGAPRDDARRPPRPAPTPKSYGRNRLAPRKAR